MIEGDKWHLPLASTCACTHMCIPIQTYTHMHACMRMNTHMHIFTHYTHVHTHRPFAYKSYGLCNKSTLFSTPVGFFKVKFLALMPVP